MEVSPADDDSASLLASAALGDGGALRALYDRFSGRVFSIARRMAGDDALAEDIAQETWIRVFRGLSGFRQQAELASWIHRIAVNTAIAAQARDERHGLHRLREHGADGEALERAPAHGAGTGGGAVLLQLQLEEALETLPVGMRRVLVLHDIEGYSHDEIAEVMGMTASTSRSQLGRARAKLRVALDGYMD